MKAKGLWIGGFQSKLGNGRGHEVVVDLPPSQDGEDTGASALELTLMSLAGCITTIFAVVAKKARFEFEGLEADLSATKGKSTIETVDVVVKVKASDKEKAEKVLDQTLKMCPVGVLFDNAGVKSQHKLIVE
ncbi:MAG: OsmC family protein [Clostridiales bacterium]|nr:OsmC family protein [Clostridiales bacterium]